MNKENDQAREAGDTAFLGPAAADVLRTIQRGCRLLGDLPLGLSADEHHYLAGELAIRSAIYAPQPDLRASPWVKRPVVCMGHLFTSPSAALADLAVLETDCQYPDLSYRLRVWRMHLCLLLGLEAQGRKLRLDLEAEEKPDDYLWAVESTTLVALSYYSSGESAESIRLHTECLKKLPSRPEVFFQAFGAAVAMRAALKCNRPEAFDFFSRQLEDALERQPDTRYELRQLGYRAMVLTQLGETRLAARYWNDGDQLLRVVDGGFATVERAQYLTLRCLAAALLGDEQGVERSFRSAEAELDQSDAFALSMAELHVCRLLVPLANPVHRARNVRRSFFAAEAAVRICREREKAAMVESARECYRECRLFCEALLGGRQKQKAGPADTWKTLTLSIIDNYQGAESFAAKVEYFRLIPRFVHELEETGLTDAGLSQALLKVLRFLPTLTPDGFQVNFERKWFHKASELQTLLRFTNTLRNLIAAAEENTAALAVAETTQMIAHDIRKPFNLLRTCLSSLAQVEDLTTARDLAMSSGPLIERAAAVVTHLLQDIMDVGGMMGLERQAVDVAMVAENALTWLGLSDRVDIKVSCDYGHRHLLEADPERLGRVVVNILENAVQAMPDGGRIWIKTEEKRVDGQPVLELRLGNESWIEAGDVPLLFDKFFTKGKRRGTGLGLAIAKKVVEAHGGTITCISSQAVGTEFIVTLPVATRQSNSTHATPRGLAFSANCTGESSPSIFGDAHALLG